MSPTLHLEGTSQRPCWYFITVWTCVLCGREDEIRERRYTPRPEHYGDRHEFIEEACSDHFC
jgi:hypothetical protein